ncbi:MAG: phosphotransferase [candidate division WOR-3 bacterium]|nr:phosphotransferase [candidate division WOR-3 bacterium]
MKVGDIVQGYKLTERIDRGGSDREFFRCTKDNTPFIMVYDKDVEQYLKLQQHLAKRKIAVPEIYWYDIEKRIMVQEDLGSRSLYEMSRSGIGLHAIYRQVIDELIRLQVEGRPGVSVECHYDAEHIRWEQEYFRKFFLIQYCGITQDASRSIDIDLEGIAKRILQLAEPISDYLMHRDFQSQNIYYKENRIRIIDFQSARIGPLTYDLGALLRDAYAEVDQQTEYELFNYYHSQLQKKGIAIAREELWQIYRLTALQRGMQALGAFANLSLNKNKTHFLKYIPRGIQLLAQGSKDTEYRMLHSIISSLQA